LPKDIDIKINLSNIYFNIQQYSKSEEFLISALKLNSDRLDIYDKLVKTYNKMGYDSSYILESCNKNNIHISDKIKEKLANKFNILEIENKTRENKINE
ncbi:tetratricopeptide repeat protein, partial [Clostridium haemolyticum]|uniref:tetratricopeptide repeat protein n=1 Tax=Clostridium haemolyticum TaxID=84025 RepID=UPI00052BB814